MLASLVPLLVIVSALVVASVQNDESLYSYSALLAIPTENNVLSDEPAIGVKTLLERGSSVYLGNGKYQYSTVLGEYNTFDGAEYVPYLYDDLNHNATFAGHSLVLYDWYATFQSTTQILIDDMRWIVQYDKNGKWNELDLWDHSFLPAVQASNLRFGQRFTDGGSILDVWYIIRNNDNIKILLNFTPDTERLYRFQWQLTGVDGLLQEGNKSMSFDDVNIGWGDSELNATYDWTVATKKVDISFDSLTIGAGETYTLDPSVNPVLGADSDDDWWNYDDTVPQWLHYTTGVDMYLREYTSGYYYTCSVRFSLAIPQAAIIDSASLTMYENIDTGNNDAEIYRINETNVGSLEADSVIPSMDYANGLVDRWDFDGKADEWHMETVTELVQDQVDLGGWVSGYYIGLNLNQSSIGPGNTYRFEDYQAAGTNHAYMNITYSTGGNEYTETIYEVIPFSDSSTVSMDAVLTVFEHIDLTETVSVGAGFVLVILEILGLAASVLTEKGVQVIIFEAIGFASVAVVSASLSTTVNETIGLVSTTIPASSIHLTVFETIPFFESVITNVAGANQFYVTIFEVIGASDSIDTALSASVEVFEEIGLSDNIASSMSASVSVFETIGLYDTVSAYRGISLTVFEIIELSSITTTSQLTHYYVFEVIGIIDSSGITGGSVPTTTPINGSLFYQLFFGLNMWGYLGPIVIVICGYLVMVKNRNLGIIWVIVEYLIMAQYFALVDATPDYWWHIVILLLGSLSTCFYVVGKRG